MRSITGVFFVAAFMVWNVSAYAVVDWRAKGPMEKFEDKQAEKFGKACQSELQRYCPAMTPASIQPHDCIYKHRDDLSAECGQTFYDNEQEFEAAGAKLKAFSRACGADIKKLCPGVRAGGGRMLACLEQNKAQVSGGCNQARANASGDLG